MEAQKRKSSSNLDKEDINLTEYPSAKKPAQNICDLCKVVLSNNREFVKHLKGDEHSKAVINSSIEKGIAKVNNRGRDGAERKFLQILNSDKVPLKPYPHQFSCELCKMMFTRALTAIQHFTGKVHRMMLVHTYVEKNAESSSPQLSNSAGIVSNPDQTEVFDWRSNSAGMNNFDQISKSHGMSDPDHGNNPDNSLNGMSYSGNRNYHDGASHPDEGYFADQQSYPDQQSYSDGRSYLHETSLPGRRNNPDEMGYPDQRNNLDDRSYLDQRNNRDQGSYPDQRNNPDERSFLDRWGNPDERSFPDKQSYLDERNYRDLRNNPDESSFLDRWNNPDERRVPVQGHNPGEHSFLDDRISLDDRSYSDKQSFPDKRNFPDGQNFPGERSFPDGQNFPGEKGFPDERSYPLVSFPDDTINSDGRSYPEGKSYDDTRNNPGQKSDFNRINLLGGISNLNEEKNQNQTENSDEKTPVQHTCDLCKVVLSNDREFVKHLKGDEHGKALIKSSIEKGIAKVNNRGRVGAKRQGPRKLRKHKFLQILNSDKVPLKPYPHQFSCELCKMMFTRAVTAIQHFTGKVHRMMLVHTYVEKNAGGLLDIVNESSSPQLSNSAGMMSNPDPGRTNSDGMMSNPDPGRTNSDGMSNNVSGYPDGMRVSNPIENATPGIESDGKRRKKTYKEKYKERRRNRSNKSSKNNIETETKNDIETDTNIDLQSTLPDIDDKNSDSFPTTETKKRRHFKGKRHAFMVKKKKKEEEENRGETGHSFEQGRGRGRSGSAKRRAKRFRASRGKPTGQWLEDKFGLGYL